MPVLFGLQVFILDALAACETSDPKDAEKIVERVLPRLQHVNSAVVLSAIKVIMKLLDVVSGWWVGGKEAM
jgi:AP-1 complex subunit beta-1